MLCQVAVEALTENVVFRHVSNVDTAREKLQAIEKVSH